MNTSPKKKNLLYIGLIAFLAIAVLGIICDFVLHTEGTVAIISVAVAFLILAVAIAIDAVGRKKAAKQAEQQENGSGEFSFNEESRFLRHTDDSTDEVGGFTLRRNETARSAFAGFARRGTQETTAELEDASGWPADDDAEPTFDESQTELSSELPSDGFETDDSRLDVEDVTDDEVFSFSEEELSQTQPAAEHTEPQSAPSQPADEVPEQPSDAEDGEADDPFKPVLRLTGEQSSQPQPEPLPEVAAPAEQPAVPAAAAEPQPQSQPKQPTADDAALAADVAAAVAAAEAKPAAPVKPTAAERRAAAAIPAASITAAATGGQSIESFYDEMSDEDILYRDCVEVWAADAKPSALKLIKYVETIEDKQTAALIGREVEYVNAMLDRINCFTQLEYIDELLEYKKHNYSTLVKDCLKRFSPFFMEKRLGLLWKGLDIDVMTDRRWFIFALTQVIFNAVEFTPQGGKIAISAKRGDDCIDLTVEDSGKGISPEELPFIFMAGYMGDDAPNESGRRTGMGLFIAQSVMRKMGGDMLAESTVGKGTRITLRMPVIEAIG